MKTLRSFVISASVAVGLAFAVAHPTYAAPIVPTGTVQAGCRDKGDLYFPPNNNGVFGCLKSNGNAVVCGGLGGYSKTCTVSQAALRILPTQPELQAAMKHYRATDKQIK